MPLQGYSKDFELSHAFVMDVEKGYVKYKHNLGGETKYGISKKQYPDEDIPNLTEDRAKNIYHQDYWLKSGADSYAWPDNIIIHDTAVLMGVKKANELRASSTGWEDYLDKRKEALIETGRKKYIQGWLNRTDKLEEYILKNTPGNLSDKVFQEYTKNTK